MFFLTYIGKELKGKWDKFKEAITCFGGCCKKFCKGTGEGEAAQMLPKEEMTTGQIAVW